MGFKKIYLFILKEGLKPILYIFPLALDSKVRKRESKA